MAIETKPKRHQKATSDNHAAEQFISGAGKTVGKKSPKGKTPTTLRFDPDLLDRIDAVAKRRGISRSAWIQYTLSAALDGESV